MRRVYSILLSLFFCLVFLGCSEGIVRKSWCIEPPTEMGSNVKSDFLEVAEILNRHLGLEWQKRFPMQDGSVHPVFYTKKLKDSLVPRWIRVAYNTEEICVYISLYEASYRPKKEAKLDEIARSIDDILQEYCEGRYSVKTQPFEEIRIPVNLW